ncbi:MAG TPA: glucokinase [Oligoflexia bacterium]|nr:glucokinase [Oligoflexia bacterium]HMP27571.1 glucokinase [Oligoflexia bacterium]
MGKLNFVAGDIGGTKTALGVFELAEGDYLPELKIHKNYQSRDYESFNQLLTIFVKECDLSSAGMLGAFGIPGVVIAGEVAPVNLPWRVSETELKQALGFRSVKLVNDLVATASGLEMLQQNNLICLHQGDRSEKEQDALVSVVVAPGTGLGHALIVSHPSGEKLILPCEAGHANFAPNSELEAELWRYLLSKGEPISVESVLSGPGLVNIYNFLHEVKGFEQPPELKALLEDGDKSAVITNTAIENNYPISTQSLDIFIGILGSHLGNFALSVLALGGIFLAGGILPRLKERLLEDLLLKAFLKKAKLVNILERIPITLVTENKTGLLGAGLIACKQSELFAQTKS